MTRKILALAFLTQIGTPVSAHRLDEYLQATILSVTRDRLSVDLTLTPGVAIFPFLLPGIDTNGDGVISDTEQGAYAKQVLDDLSFRIDGRLLRPRLRSAEFPPIGDMKEGRGEIRLELEADLPGGGSSRKLVFENHHQNTISVYQVNVLVPRDPEIRMRQNRNYSQSLYELDFDQAGVAAGRPASAILASTPGELGMIFALAIVVAWVRLKRANRRLDSTSLVKL